MDNQKRLSGDPQKHRQTTTNFKHDFIAGRTKRLTEFVPLYGHGFIYHHLRRFLDVVYLVWLNGYAKQRRINQRARHKQDSHGCVLVEWVGLDSQGWFWLAQIALHGDGHKVTPIHAVQPSISDKA